MTKTRAALIATTFALAATLGMTASIWNPITRAYDRMTQELTTHTEQVANDAATPDPAPIPYWEPVDSELADALAEGEYPQIADAWTYDWERCLAHYAPTTIISCPGNITITIS